MKRSATAVGLDVGAVYVKMVVLDGQGRAASTVARRHHGNPVAVVHEELERLDLSGPLAIGLTGANSSLLADLLKATPVDFVQAEIVAVRRRFPHARNILNVGGGSVTLIQLDENGRFLDFNTNSLCAAGTGSFLDQQADRLGIRYDDLDRFGQVQDPPSIATRCSVFAKSDLVHRQQEGYSKAELWCGLCRSMTGTFLNTLLRGRPLQGLTVLTGGVSRNAEVLRWLRARYGDQVQTYEHAPFSCAEGAAALTNGLLAQTGETISGLACVSEHDDQAPRRPPLVFRKSRYPDFGAAEMIQDDAGNEIRVTRWPVTPEPEVCLGIDVGSTSTKCVIIDQSGAVLADVYRRTAGDPIRATQHLFRALADLARQRGTRLRVAGVGTTGSGRKLVGKVVGADAVINEITAHLAGAMHVDSAIDTVFEIGGQDSKYIHARAGRIVDSNMNYVCAAGTGSFVEEQANKLGFALHDVGDAVIGVAPPITSDRCTVFMEQDVDRLIRRGFTREECMAAVLCSVVKNYLTKVVGRRHVSRDRIFFQGATARNKGLVAAFENVLNAEIVVSPYCHVMGAYGVALLTQRRMAERRATTTFRGLDLSDRTIALRTETCNLCSNHCKIAFADIQGEPDAPSWGYMCGRDPDDTRVRVNEHFRPFQNRLQLHSAEHQPPASPPVATVGLPRGLVTFSYLPMWQRFFAELGAAVRLSTRTSEATVAAGNELSAADFCFPVKLAHGAAAELAADPAVDFLFIPHMIQADPNPATTGTHFCPYVQAFPSVVRSALRLRGADDRIVSPVINLRESPRRQVSALHAALADRLRVTRGRVAAAWRAARRAWRAHLEARRQEGRRVLAELAASGQKAIVFLGRPYNILDLHANLALPRKVAELGLRVIPMDILPYDIARLNPAFRGMYWQYGQHVLAAAEFVRNHPDLFAICLTNFSCGPDSFLLTFVDDIFGDKPWLVIELDEHGGDAGYLTRIEAFLDVVRSWKTKPRKPYSLPSAPCSVAAVRSRKLWIPPMHPFASRLFAAGFRSEGFDAEVLPPEDVPTFDLGRALTRGSECLPAALTTGAVIRALRERPGERHALFMPCAEGPCRFGQYATLQRIVLNRQGHQDVPILSPSSGNTYQGLSQRLRMRLWHAVMAADSLFKCGCRVRPYEKTPGDVDAALENAMQRAESALASAGDVLRVVAETVAELGRIPRRPGPPRPLVGIVGEIYVRSNPFSNDRLVEQIERAGAEAWLTPASEWVLYTAALGETCGSAACPFLARVFVNLKNRFLFGVERRFQEITAPLLHDRREPHIHEILSEGRSMLPIEFGGESILTIGRTRLFARQGAQLVVNVAPFGCMPGTITSALCRELQAIIGIPVVSMFYDGEQAASQRLEVFLRSLDMPATP